MRTIDVALSADLNDRGDVRWGRPWDGQIECLGDVWGRWTGTSSVRPGDQYLLTGLLVLMLWLSYLPLLRILVNNVIGNLKQIAKEYIFATEI